MSVDNLQLRGEHKNTGMQLDEEGYRLLVDNLPVGICRVTPGPEGKFLMANPAMVKMLGFDNEGELKKVRVCDLYRDPEDRAKYSERLLQHEFTKGSKLLLRKKDGTPIVCSDRASVFWDGKGVAVFFDCILEDITEPNQVKETLKLREERYRGILEAIEEAYYECDLRGYITFCNDAVVKLIGYSKAELMGMSYRILYKDPDRVFSTFNKVYQTGVPNKGFSLEMLRKDGQVIFGELSVSPIKNNEGEVIGFRGVGKDITERKMFEEKLKYLSLHDQLTGLYNRAYFEEELQRLKASRNDPITVISVDLDGLKIVNDSLGHKQGDHLLKACAQVLKKPLRISDVLARVGGDEFVIVLPRTDEVDRDNIIKRIQTSVEEYNKTGGEVPLIISIGAATCKDAGEQLEETYRKADDMMYTIKYGKVSSVREEYGETFKDLIKHNPEKGRRITRAFSGLTQT